MKQKLIGLSVVAATLASLPMIYQGNPELFHALLRGAGSEPGSPAGIVAAHVSEPVPVAPSGRRTLVRMDDRGHFVAEFKINGRRVDAMIDTGATLVALNKTTARRVGLNLVGSDFRYKVSTANGIAMAAAARVASLEIGRIVIRDVEVVVLDDTSLRGTLIGMSFLKRLGQFRVENQTLLMEQ